MAVEGDLKDLEITSLLQVLCTERRSAGLVVRRRGEEGVIYLDQGELVHAALGPIEGEEAAFQILSWRDGAFRITDQARPKRRTIHAEWRHLMLEAMRQLDEKRRHLPSHPGPLPGSQDLLVLEAADAELEAELMHLLSRLEQGMARWGEEKQRKRPLLALEQLGDMVEQVLATAQHRAPVGATEALLERSLETAIRNFPMARLLTVQGKGLSLTNALNLYRTWSEDSRDRERVFREISHGLAAILDSYFELFAQVFHSPGTRAEWRESYGVFSRDLALAIDRQPF